jgi:hypothetical protein
MAKRTTFHVTKRKDDDGWRVIRENASRASSVTDTKAEAVADARARAKAEPLGQVKVHKEDGKIQTEYTYGKDRFPPAG